MNDCLSKSFFSEKRFLDCTSEEADKIMKRNEIILQALRAKKISDISDDVDIDELQELIEYCESSREYLDSFEAIMEKFVVNFKKIPQRQRRRYCI